MNGSHLSPLESGKFIAENSKDVSIDPVNLSKTADMISNGIKAGELLIHTDRWKTHQLNPKTADVDAVRWVFLSAVGNFSFWSSSNKPKYHVKYNGQIWTGYWSWIAAINRALDEDRNICNAEFLSNLTMKELKHILRSDSETEMELLDERLQVLREAGCVLLENFNGDFINLLHKCNKSAQNLVQAIVEHFPSFKDTAVFNGKTVCLYKRAQILVADIWACCGGKGLGEFHDIDTITIFADYRVPQILAHFNILKYSDELMDLLKKETLMTSGERLEVEIRGCTIWAAELLVQEIRKRLESDEIKNQTHVNSILVDHFLWDYRRERDEETSITPMHYIRCIYY